MFWRTTWGVIMTREIPQIITDPTPFYCFLYPEFYNIANHNVDRHRDVYLSYEVSYRTCQWVIHVSSGWSDIVYAMEHWFLTVLRHGDLERYPWWKTLNWFLTVLRHGDLERIQPALSSVLPYKISYRDIREYCLLMLRCNLNISYWDGQLIFLCGFLTPN